MDETIYPFAKENKGTSGGEKEERGLFDPIHSQKEVPFSKRSRNNIQKKGKSKIRRLDMSRFAPPKAKRPTNLWALLPSTKSMETSTITTTTPSTAGPRVADTTTTRHLLAGCARDGDCHILFCPV